MTLWSSGRRRRVIEGNRNTGPCMTSLPVMETSGLRTRLWTHGGAVPFLNHLGGPGVIKSLLLDHASQPQPHSLPQKDRSSAAPPPPKALSVFLTDTGLGARASLHGTFRVLQSVQAVYPWVLGFLLSLKYAPFLLWPT